MGALVEKFVLAGNSPASIYVLTPYKAQMELLDAGKKYVDLNVGTIDSMQGSEGDIVILSAVCTNRMGDVGDQCSFLSGPGLFQAMFDGSTWF